MKPFIEKVSLKYLVDNLAAAVRNSKSTTNAVLLTPSLEVNSKSLNFSILLLCIHHTLTLFQPSPQGNRFYLDDHNRVPSVYWAIWVSLQWDLLSRRIISLFESITRMSPAIHLILTDSRAALPFDTLDFRLLRWETAVWCTLGIDSELGCVCTRQLVTSRGLHQIRIVQCTDTYPLIVKRLSDTAIDIARELWCQIQIQWV